MWYIYVYTHIDIWVIYVHVCLRGLRLSERSSQNTEPRDDGMSFSALFSEARQPQKSEVLTTEVWLKWCFFFYTFEFLLSNSRGKESSRTAQLSLLCPHFFFYVYFYGPFFVSLWSLLWKMRRSREAQHILARLQPPCPATPLPPPRLPLQDESRCDCLYWVDGSSTTVEQSSVIGSVSTGFSWHCRASLCP